MAEGAGLGGQGLGSRRPDVDDEGLAAVGVEEAGREVGVVAGADLPRLHPVGLVDRHVTARRGQVVEVVGPAHVVGVAEGLQGDGVTGEGHPGVRGGAPALQEDRGAGGARHDAQFLLLQESRIVGDGEVEVVVDAVAGAARDEAGPVARTLGDADGVDGAEEDGHVLRRHDLVDVTRREEVLPQAEDAVQILPLVQVGGEDRSRAAGADAGDAGLRHDRGARGDVVDLDVGSVLVGEDVDVAVRGGGLLGVQEELGTAQRPAGGRRPVVFPVGVGGDHHADRQRGVDDEVVPVGLPADVVLHGAVLRVDDEALALHQPHAELGVVGVSVARIVHGVDDAGDGRRPGLGGDDERRRPGEGGGIGRHVDLEVGPDVRLLQRGGDPGGE